MARKRRSFGQSRNTWATARGDELGVRDPWWASGTPARFEEVVELHVESDDEGVEGGEHAASLVDVALTTSPFGVLTTSPRGVVAGNSESTI